MNSIKKILLPLCSVFLLYFSWKMLNGLLESDPEQLSSRDVIVLSFLLTLCITGVFAFVGFAYPTNKLLPSSYYRIKNPRILNFVGKVIGVKYFKYLLLLFFWGRKGNREKYFNGTKGGLENFVFQTKLSEVGHLGALVLISIASICLLFYGYYAIALVMTIINIIGNFYPVVLQRLHRGRVSKIVNAF